MVNFNKILKVGIICGEFFSKEARGFGGFGMATKNIAEYFNTNVKSNIEIVILLAYRSSDDKIINNSNLK